MGALVKAFVGAGGKTTAVYKEARMWAEMGKKVFITTSTHMLIEETTDLSGDADIIIEKLNKDGMVHAGISGGGKLNALPEDVYKRVCEQADVVLIEADGSRCHPIKFPNDTEPVYYGNVTDVMVVMGLNAIGERLEDVCHRPELAAAVLGAEDGTIITAAHIQKLIREGYLKPLKEKGYNIEIYPTHIDSPYKEAVAKLLISDEDVDLIEESVRERMKGDSYE